MCRISEQGSQQFDNGDLRQNTNPARVADETIPAVYIQFLFAFFVEPGPFPVYILNWAPFYTWYFHAKLHAMRMASQSQVNIGKF